MCRKTLVTVYNILSDRQCRLLITLQTVRTKIRTNWKSFLVCIQNVWHSNWVPERIFAKDIKSIQLVKKDLFGFNGQQTSNNVGMTGFVHLNWSVLVTLATNSRLLTTWWGCHPINTEFSVLHRQSHTSFSKQCRYRWEAANKERVKSLRSFKIVFWNYLLVNKLFCSKNKKNSPWSDCIDFFYINLYMRHT